MCINVIKEINDQDINLSMLISDINMSWDYFLALSQYD